MFSIPTFDDIFDLPNIEKTIKRYLFVNISFNFILIIIYSVLIILYNYVWISLYSYVIFSIVSLFLLNLFMFLTHREYLPCDRCKRRTPELPITTISLSTWDNLSSSKKEFYLSAFTLIILSILFVIGEIDLWFNKSEINFGIVENLAIITTHIFLLQMIMNSVYLCYLSRYSN